MTTQDAFSPEEWKVVLEGPPAAGLIVITAGHGGTFRETIAISKAYAEARAEHRVSSSMSWCRRSPWWTTRGTTQPKSSGIAGSGTFAMP